MSESDNVVILTFNLWISPQLVSYKFYFAVSPNGKKTLTILRSWYWDLPDESEIKIILAPSYNFYQTQYQVLTRE
jgi:hypothetical protein